MKKAPPFVACGRLGACTRSICRSVPAGLACEKQCGRGRSRGASSAPVVLALDNQAVLAVPAEGCSLPTAPSSTVGEYRAHSFHRRAVSRTRALVLPLTACAILTHV